MLLELLDHVIKIGIAGAKAPCEPVLAALGNPLAVSDFMQWTMKTGRSDPLVSASRYYNNHPNRLRLGWYLTRQFGLGILRRYRLAMRQYDFILQEQGFVDRKRSPMTCEPVCAHVCNHQGKDQLEMITTDVIGARTIPAKTAPMLPEQMPMESAE